MEQVKANDPTWLFFKSDSAGVKAHVIISQKLKGKVGRECDFFECLTILGFDNNRPRIEPMGLYMQVGCRFLNDGHLEPSIQMEWQKFKDKYIDRINLKTEYIKRKDGTQLEFALGTLKNDKFVSLEESAGMGNAITDFSFTLFYKVFNNCE